MNYYLNMPPYIIHNVSLFYLYLFKIEKDIEKCRNELVKLRKLKEEIIKNKNFIINKV